MNVTIDSMKLLITGGHVTPALACIDYIREKNLPIQIFFAGRQFAQKTDTEPSLEYQEICKRHIQFYDIPAGRLTRSLSWQSIQHLLSIPKGFKTAFQLINEIKPDAVLSFGGYLALPVALAARWKAISVYTHEQTMRPGLANILIGRVAKKVFVAFEETKTFFATTPVLHTGNPLRQQITHIDHQFIRTLNLPTGRKTIFVTGGSLGAHAINQHIFNILNSLLQKYNVIHQTGNVAEYHDYETAQNLKQQMSVELQSYYHIQPHFLADQIGSIFGLADMVISRSGANTFFELVKLKKPAILIPLPISAHNEQLKQAEKFVQQGLGQIFLQNEPSQNLLHTIDTMVKNLPNYLNNFSKLSIYNVEDPCKQIIQSIFPHEG